MSSSERPRRGTWVLLGLMLIVYLLLAITSLRHKSVTVDEFGHLPAGHNLLSSGDLGYAELNPPLMNALSALPMLWIDPPRSEAARPPRFRNFDPGYSFWHNGYAFMFDYRDDYRRLFTAARCVTVFLVAGGGLLLFGWARTLVDRRRDFAGLLSVALWWFSPNVLAHARLVTTDAAAAVFMALAVWGFHRLLLRGGPWRAAASGVLLGLAQLVKFTAIYLYPIFVVYALVWRRLRPETRWRELVRWTAVACLVSLVTLNAGYLFDGTFKLLGTYTFSSQAGAGLQQALPGAIPIPLPSDFVAAFDKQLYEVELGTASYLLGESFEGGVWYFFPVLLATKTPLPLAGLFVLAAVLGWPIRRSSRFETVLLLLPAAVLLFVFSFLAEKQLGLRMLLPAAPLVYLWIATTLAAVEWRRWTRWTVAALMALFAVESLLAYPDYLAYFNWIAGGPAGGYRVAVASNVDWGQDLPKLKDYLDREGIDRLQLFYFGRVDPGIYEIPYFVDTTRFRPGYIAISVTLYARWYRLYDHGRVFAGERVDPTPLGRPVARIGDSIHVYRLEGPAIPIPRP